MMSEPSISKEHNKIIFQGEISTRNLKDFCAILYDRVCKKSYSDIILDFGKGVPLTQFLILGHETVFLNNEV